MHVREAILVLVFATGPSSRQTPNSTPFSGHQLELGTPVSLYHSVRLEESKA